MLTCLFAFGCSAEARAEDREETWCAAAQLREARASASIELDHDERVHTKATSRLTVRVPLSWRFAHDLLLSRGTDQYRRAMSCLTRPLTSQHRRWTEWRASDPIVTIGKGVLNVQVDSFAWIDDHRNAIVVGPWTITVGAAHWTVRFTPGTALRRSNWQSIKIDSGRPGAEMANPTPTGGNGRSALVWEPKEWIDARNIWVRLEPSWQRSWAAQSKRPLFGDISDIGGRWSFLVCLMLINAARHGRRRSDATLSELKAARNLKIFALVTISLSLLTATSDIAFRHGFSDGAAWQETEPRIRFLMALLEGVTLLVFGNPRRSIIWAGGVLCASAVAVVLSPETFGLTTTFSIPEGAHDYTVIVLFIVSGCVLAINFLGFIATGWRLAQDGDLIPLRQASLQEPRELRLRDAGPWIIVIVAFLGACFAVAAERNWQRASWLSQNNRYAYENAHIGQLRDNLTWFIANHQAWWSGYYWILIGIAIIAALRVNGRRVNVSPLAEQPERLLAFLLFPVAVGINIGVFVDNAALALVTPLVYVGALHLSLKIGRGRVVLNYPLEISKLPLAEAITPASRSELLVRARRYREFHALLRRLDQGQPDDVPERNVLERRLHRLHNWRSGSGATDRLPSQVSVVDAVLALGPCDTWWENGRRGALFAMISGLPASILVVWAETLSGEFLQNTLFYEFGMPDVVMTFVFWQIVWAGAGFLLGSLWRVLPGRRGPVRALPITLAFALPLGLTALGNWALGHAQTNLALYVSAILLTLTLTGILMDLDTFRDERRYWQSRFGLLLSVYQMRYASLQLAYLAAQVIAVITIWQFFAGASEAPPKELGPK
ncbi:DUF6185 family protein [Streptomyces sp. URMC 124]|uniref:DUF6185 family protein n=1 Tax=Streptomyces sp. URMC 124 TaxID=3423405 RepID=UPI003F1D5F43